MYRSRSMALVTCCVLVLALGPGATVTTGAASQPADRTPTLQCTGSGSVHSSPVVSATPPNSSVRLELDDTPDSTYYKRPNSSFGTAVAMADARLRNQYHLQVTEEQIGGVADRDIRWTVVQAGLQRIGTRLSELRAGERQTLRRYATGEASAADVIRRLAMVRAEALAMDGTLLELRRTVQLRNRKEIIDSIRGRIQTFTGPVREYLADALRGTGSVPRLSVVATDRGYVIATVDGNRFLREAIRYDNRDRIGEPEITSSSEAADRVRQLYPGTGAGTDSALITSLRYYTGSTQLISSTIAYGDGTTTTTFIDATTRAVFYEEKVQTLTRIPTSIALNVTLEDVRIKVSRTYNNGPARVTVFDTETGEPLDAGVAINGQTVGHTGDDGQYWYVGPPFDYGLTVTVNGEEANVTITTDGTAES